MSDPTDHVQTYEGARVLACAMLYPPACISAPRSPSTDLWKSLSEPVLAALLLAASPCQHGGGIAWVNHAVSTLAQDTGDACDAVAIEDPEGRRYIQSVATMDGGQRDSILMTVRDAVLPWLAA